MIFPMSKLIRVCIGVLLLFVVFPYSAKVLAQDVKAKEILRIGKGAMTLVSMRPDGKMVAIGVGNTISLYDDTAKAVGELDGQSGKITTWAWSKDDTKMVTVTDDGSAVVRDGSTGKVILTLKGHTNRINDVEISEDGKTIITGSEDKTAALLGASSGALLQTLQGFSSGVKSVYLSIDTGDRAYTLDGEQRMWIWDTKSGKLLTKLTKPDGELSFINVSADLKYFVVNDKGSKDNSVTVFDGLTG